MKQGEEYSKSLAEDVVSSTKLKKRVNSELKYLNEKLDQCKDMFARYVTVEKRIKKMTTETKQNWQTEEQKNRTKKKHRESNNFKLLHRLL